MQDVLVDARVIDRGHTGIARYVRELAPRLSGARGVRLSALVTRSSTGLDGASLVHARAGFLSPAEQLELPLRVAAWRGWSRRHAPFWVPAYDVPALAPGPLVTTIHDANHLAFPEQYSAAKALYYRTIVRLACVRARAILAPSAFAKQELVTRLGADPAKIHVTLLGVSPRGRPAPARIAAVRATLALPGPYVAYLGNFKAHKNVPMLLRAARRFPADVTLVLVGGREDELGPALADARRDGARVHVVPALSDDDLWPFLAGASVFAFPSKYEGFGLPPLEAMALGVPVVTTRAGSLPEVVGDAAPTCDPDDADGFGDAIARLLGDEALARSRSAQGLARAATFTWDRCADETAAVLRAAGLPR
jgi:glycosyltransferase involved in cell wall biosynthesis